MLLTSNLYAFVQHVHFYPTFLFAYFNLSDAVHKSPIVKFLHYLMLIYDDVKAFRYHWQFGLVFVPHQY